MEQVVQFLPVISSMIAAFLGYFFGQRGKKNQQFIKQVENSLDEVCAPLFYELKKIKEISNNYKKEKMLKVMFEKYTAENSKVHKIGNMNILECFYELEKTFSILSKERKDNDRIKFNIQFSKFYSMVEKEYWINVTVMYRDYRWFTYSSSKSYFTKYVVGLTRFIYEIAKLFVIIWLLGCYLLIYQKIIGQAIVPLFVSEIIIYSSAPVILLFLFTWMIIITYKGVIYQKRSEVSRWMRKKFPRLMHFWEGESFENPKIDKNKIDIPKMYKKEGPFNF